ncbi:MAG: DUF3524 domain-containing protein [Desulfosarcina sp.]
MAPQLKFLCLEPFFGGSHREFAQGWVAHSRHCIDLLTLPARFWKWRMRGAARRPVGGHGSLCLGALNRSLRCGSRENGALGPRVCLIFHARRFLMGKKTQGE